MARAIRTPETTSETTTRVVAWAFASSGVSPRPTSSTRTAPVAPNTSPSARSVSKATRWRSARVGVVGHERRHLPTPSPSHPSSRIAACCSGESWSAGASSSLPTISAVSPASSVGPDFGVEPRAPLDGENGVAGMAMLVDRFERVQQVVRLRHRLSG